MLYHNVVDCETIHAIFSISGYVYKISYRATLQRSLAFQISVLERLRN